ncbi:hypothetical protein JOC77_003550 [Peribacillus deserti]|uniref:Uncharacterized protein n=1 Tax=Peribacillus deserti TaxID=673318 RepID=A0ABS2QPB8_9BACI|nr:hypothetical protein [Peribacillus deserti]MBM7694106.1 hypothetical protein [Peribacillus deserti]
MERRVPIIVLLAIGIIQAIYAFTVYPFKAAAVMTVFSAALLLFVFFLIIKGQKDRNSENQ